MLLQQAHILFIDSKTVHTFLFIIILLFCLILISKAYILQLVTMVLYFGNVGQLLLFAKQVYCVILTSFYCSEICHLLTRYELISLWYLNTIIIVHFSEAQKVDSYYIHDDRQEVKWMVLSFSKMQEILHVMPIQMFVRRIISSNGVQIQMICLLFTISLIVSLLTIIYSCKSLLLTLLKSLLRIFKWL